MTKLMAHFQSAFLTGLRGGQWLVVLVLLGACPAVFAEVVAVPTTPTSDFTDNKDGTVTHKSTKLTWMRCAFGQTWTGTTCSGTASTFDYATALLVTQTFAGKSDWRLPNVRELQTLVERAKVNPAINTELFPNTSNSEFWSSSPDIGNTNEAWSVRFSDGYVNNGSRGRAFPVRFVRANQSLSLGLSTPDTDFTDNKDGTVTHKPTGLMWQRCILGQFWTGSDCVGNAVTYRFDAALSLTNSFAGHDDWRMPTANELARLVNYDATTPPMINTTLFPNTPNNAFWSSSPYVGYSNYAWNVIFDLGYVSYSYRSSAFPVRLVRASQLLDIGLTTPDLATTLTASTDRVQLKHNLTYTATVTNAGGKPAKNATLIMYFPPRWTKFVAVPQGCVANGTRYSCSVSELAAGASFTRAFTVNYAQRGATSILALGITDSVDNNDSNNSGRLITTITR